MPIKVRIENSYTDGHESESEHVLDTPDLTTEDYTSKFCMSEDPVDEWFDQDVHEFTGDGHYTEVYEATGERLGSCYTATVVESDHPQIPVGRSYEWLD